MKYFTTPLCLAALLATQTAFADFPMSDPQPDPAAPPASAQPAAAQTPPMSAEQIDSLIAPIALYPDELVSQILVAATYPLEIVQAYQWLGQHSDLKGQELTAAAQKQNWDPSIQALVAFPDVMKRLNQDITWTTNLGNAFLANQAAVMDQIQAMRAKAESAGKLTTTPQQTVTNTTDNGHPVVQIEPASSDVVYVPDYDPVWIWGPAPAYYPYPYWYYPPAPPFGVWCWWGPRIYLGSFFFGWNGWGGWGWHPHWYEHNVIVNRSFVTVNHFNNFRTVNVHGAAVWQHNPEHRIGVAYPNRTLSHDFRPAGRVATGHVSVVQARQQFQAAGARFNASERFGNRQVSPGVFNRNRTAFGGIEAGGSARAHSTRGNSSLGYAHGAARSGGGHVSGGGEHGGGGGGEHGGGGGGGHR